MVRYACKNSKPNIRSLIKDPIINTKDFSYISRMGQVDIIGDIHGYADHLERLLQKMGYARKNGAYAHSERTALFVGDYIDRGPKIPETLQIVRAMVDNGSAIALMGNHEYNAICFHLEHKSGGHLRKHTIKNIKQHADTLLQFQNQQGDYESYIKWFMSLPLWYEDSDIRAVHACWDQDNLSQLEATVGGNQLDEETIRNSCQKDHPLHRLVDETLKGKEVAMPLGQSFFDKDGHERHHIRTKWWLNPASTTYREISILPMDDRLPDSPVAAADNTHYARDEKPVFFGHYWLRGEPNLFGTNLCCLDFSVAKGGYLTAYRFNGEYSLMNKHFCYV